MLPVRAEGWEFPPVTVIGNKGKIEPKKLLSTSIPNLLIAYTWQIEILTAPSQETVKFTEIDQNLAIKTNATYLAFYFPMAQEKGYMLPRGVPAALELGVA